MYYPDADRSTEEVRSPPLVSIQIEEAGEDPSAGSQSRTDGRTNWQPWSSGASPCEASLQSTNSPFQAPSVYHLASLVPPLLAGAVENIDLDPRRPGLVQGYFRFFEAIASIKVDSYLDLLEVIAYHTPKARRAALNLLSTFWPKALGHLVLSKPFPTLDYIGDLSGRPRRDMNFGHDTHQFVPWKFIPSSTPALLGHFVCRSCSTTIRGFGLFCPLCMCAVHFGCYDYPEGSQVSEYVLPSEPATRRIAIYRFCHIPSPRADRQPQTFPRERHRFKFVNLFTLSLCFICRKPLWGCTAQALRCMRCTLFAHSTCLSEPSTSVQSCDSVSMDPSYLEIDWSELRQSFLDHYKDLLLSQEVLESKTYEEISAISAVLWTQLHIMNNGANLGSIVVRHRSTRSAKERKIADFDLHHLVNLCETTLASGVLPVSEALEEWYREHRIKASEQSFMFDWPTLIYITVNVKSSFDIPQRTLNTSSSLLDVNVYDSTRAVKDTSQGPFEVAPLSHMRDALGYVLDMHLDAAACLVLSHLHHLGFFDRHDRGPILFDGKGHPKGTECTFPLPLGLDLSVDVETLVSAVEACLVDLNLSVNEAGFLLLVRKLWPTAVTSDYALRRIARTVLSWIFAEVSTSQEDLQMMLF
jgi:hypothetical protein